MSIRCCHTTVTALMALALAACGAKAPEPVEPVVTEPPAPEPLDRCSELKQRASSVWSRQIQAELDLQVKVYEDDIDASDAEKAVAWMNVLSRGWVRAGDATCKDLLLSQKIGEEEFNSRFGCLDRVLEKQQKIVTLLETQGEQAADGVKDLVVELESCVPVDAGRPNIKENPF